MWILFDIMDFVYIYHISLYILSPEKLTKSCDKLKVLYFEVYYGIFRAMSNRLMSNTLLEMYVNMCIFTIRHECTKK